MNNVGAFWIAMSIAFAGYNISDALRNVQVEMKPVTLRIASEADDGAR